MLVTMDTERRKFTRFFGPENAYAALGPSFEKVGRIKDISIGGLKLVYLTDEEFESKNSQVDIFLRGEEYHLSKIPCTIVYDVQIEASGFTKSYPKGVFYKRCGTKFDQLTRPKKKWLEYFLSNHTTGVA